MTYLPTGSESFEAEATSIIMYGRNRRTDTRVAAQNDPF